jgi:hypothetical protein
VTLPTCGVLITLEGRSKEHQGRTSMTSHPPVVLYSIGKVHRRWEVRDNVYLSSPSKSCYIILDDRKLCLRDGRSIGLGMTPYLVTIRH